MWWSSHEVVGKIVYDPLAVTEVGIGFNNDLYDAFLIEDAQKYLLAKSDYKLSRNTSSPTTNEKSYLCHGGGMHTSSYYT
jgi:hypothetical protein